MPSHQSRRTFIAQAAAAASIAAVVGSAEASVKPRFKATRSKTKINPPKDGETIRMAVIGTGGMGTGHCMSTCDMAKRGEEDVQIVAVADVNQVRMGDTAKQIDEKQGGKVDQYTDYRELLARDDIHGVLVAVPEHWHSQVVIDAINAGKDVYGEKPMTFRLSQAMEVLDTINSNPDRIYQVGTQKMMLPKYHEAKKLIDSGRLGKAVSSQNSYCRNTPDGEWNYYPLDDRWEPGKNVDWKMWLGYEPYREWDPKLYARWRRYKDFSTGIVGDLLVHVITPMLMAIDAQVGWPTRVVASGGHYIDKEMENHDQVNIEVQFEGGHTMVSTGSTCNQTGLEDLIRCQKGNIYLNSRHCVVRPEPPFVDEIDPETIECPDIGNDQEQLRLNWWKCMRSREKNISTIDYAIKVMVIVELATRSMWEGSAFGYDPDAMSVRKL